MHKKRKFRIIAFHYLVLVPCLSAMGLAVLARDSIPQGLLKILLMGSWTLFMAGCGMMGPAWMDWIAHLFRREIRGTITGLSWGCSSLAGIAGALISGWALRGNPGVSAFGWLYLAAALFATASISIFLAIRDPAQDLTVDRAPGLREMLAATAESLSDRPFRNLLIGRCLGWAGFCIAPPYIAPTLSFPLRRRADRQLGRLHGRSANGRRRSLLRVLRPYRRPDRPSLRPAHGHRLSNPVAFERPFYLPARLDAFFAMLFSGGVGGTLLISYLNLVIESCPHEVRSAHLMIGNMVVGVAGLLFPLAGAAIAVQAGIPILMQVSLAVSVIKSARLESLQSERPRDVEQLVEAEVPAP